MNNNIQKSLKEINDDNDSDDNDQQRTHQGIDDQSKQQYHSEAVTKNRDEKIIVPAQNLLELFPIDSHAL
jgi:hypothetical protein